MSSGESSGKHRRRASDARERPTSDSNRNDGRAGTGQSSSRRHSRNITARDTDGNVPQTQRDNKTFREAPVDAKYARNTESSPPQASASSAAQAQARADLHGPSATEHDRLPHRLRPPFVGLPATDYHRTQNFVFPPRKEPTTDPTRHGRHGPSNNAPSRHPDVHHGFPTLRFDKDVGSRDEALRGRLRPGAGHSREPSGQSSLSPQRAAQPSSSRTQQIAPEHREPVTRHGVRGESFGSSSAQRPQVAFANPPITRARSAESAHEQG